MKKIIFFMIMIIQLVGITSEIAIVENADPRENNSLRNFNVDLTGINKVMFVAHPDDDMIWGGSHLIDDDYLVVCITCGARKDRVEEFKNVMTATGDKYIMLDYPDKTNGERDNWNTVYDDIMNDIERILNLKEWELIVTHNKDGEYGHIHHKLTHKIVTIVYEQNYIDKGDLYYFGKYYTEEKLPSVLNKLTEISPENYQKKEAIIYKYYVSQRTVADGLKHMFKYENWTEYQGENNE